MKKTALVAIMILTSAATALADFDSDVKAGNSAFWWRDYETAIKYYESAVSQNQNDILKRYIEETKELLTEKQAALSVPKNLVSLNVYRLITEGIELRYLRVLGEYHSFSASLIYRWRYEQYAAVGISLDWFFWYSPHGLHVGAGMEGGSLWHVAGATNIIDQEFTFGADLHAGYRWIINSVVSINVSTGIQFGYTAGTLGLEAGYLF